MTIKNPYITQLEAIAKELQTHLSPTCPILIEKSIDLNYQVIIQFRNIVKQKNNTTRISICGRGNSCEDACRNYIEQLRNCDSIAYYTTYIINSKMVHDIIDQTTPIVETESIADQWGELISQCMTKVEQVKETTTINQRKDDKLTGMTEGFAQALTIFVLLEKGWSKERIMKALKLI